MQKYKNSLNVLKVLVFKLKMEIIIIFVKKINFIRMKKNKKALQAQYDFIIEYFQEHNPAAASELQFKNPYQLLVAVVLSAQCTDKRVNMITPPLFEKYPTPEKMAIATESEIYEMIKSVSYPNSKAKHLKGLSLKLVSDYGGVVPQTQEQLLTLPGVGRKSANVVLSVCFDQPYMPVDTHVFRVANRLGIVHNAKTPLDVELQLTENFPKHLIPVAHHWLILHGRYICLARKPQCDKCGLTSICDYYQSGKNKV